MRLGRKSFITGVLNIGRRWGKGRDVRGGRENEGLDISCVFEVFLRGNVNKRNSRIVICLVVFGYFLYFLARDCFSLGFFRRRC